MPQHEIKIGNRSSEEENTLRADSYAIYKECPIPAEEILPNLGLFLDKRTISRILFMHELYKKIINIHGIVIEFGVRWGQNIALFESFRAIYEPFNYTRKIVGFDTFDGFPSIHSKDGSADIASIGAYSVTDGYDAYLERLLTIRQRQNPLPHLKKYQLVKGDASNTISQYLQDNPETIIAMAYFDFDIYAPTKDCLVAIKEHLTKGSVIGFDELNSHDFPGETLALKEVFGLDRYTIQRSPMNSMPSYIVIE